MRFLVVELTSRYVIPHRLRNDACGFLRRLDDEVLVGEVGVAGAGHIGEVEAHRCSIHLEGV